MDGITTSNGERKPGLMDLLMRIFLDKYLADLKNDRQPKKCIIFCRGSNMLAEIYVRLMKLTNHKFKDCRDSPFVMNHSSLLPPSAKVIRERASEISLYLSSNKMLLGIDLADIDIIIFCVRMINLLQLSKVEEEVEESC